MDDNFRVILESVNQSGSYPEVSIFVEGDLNEFWNWRGEDGCAFDEGCYFDVVSTNHDHRFILTPPEKESPDNIDEWISIIQDQFCLHC